MKRSYVSTPTWVYTLTLLLFHGYLGAGSVLRPEPDSDILPLKIMSLHDWGILFLVGAAFTLIAAMTQNKVTAVFSVLAALPFTTFGAAMFATEAQDARLGISGLFIVPIVLHAVMAWHSWRQDGTLVEKD